MRIGIVSDLHGRVPAALHDEFRSVDRILCAGDVGRQDVLWELETIAPVICVAGNNDWSIPKLPQSSNFTLGGVHFFMTHIPKFRLVPAEDVDVVIYGHTHIPQDEVRNGVRYLNPGSARQPRGGSEPSCMRADVADGKLINVQLVTLPY